MCKERLDEDTLTKDFIAMAMSSVADLWRDPDAGLLKSRQRSPHQHPVHTRRQLGMADEERTVR